MKALKYGDLMIKAYDETNDAFFMMLAQSFLGRMENDLFYRGGTDEDVIAVMDKNLYAVKQIAGLMKENESLKHSYDRHSAEYREDPLRWNLHCRLDAKDGRRAELLKNEAYMEVLNKYKTLIGEGTK